MVGRVNLECLSVFLSVCLTIYRGRSERNLQVLGLSLGLQAWQQMHLVFEPI